MIGLLLPELEILSRSKQLGSGSAFL